MFSLGPRGLSLSRSTFSALCRSNLAIRLPTASLELHRKDIQALGRRWPNSMVPAGTVRLGAVAQHDSHLSREPLMSLSLGQC